MDLRQQIKKDFGYELNIGNGLGTSDEPLQILDDNPADAAVTEIIFIRLMSHVHRRIWMINSREFVERSGKKLLQTKLDTIQITESEFIKEVINYYFELPTEEIGYFPYVDSIENSKIPLPFSIGWFHYDRKLDNRDQDPSLGITYEFSNGYSKLAIYVYDYGIENIPDGISLLLQEHSHQLILDIKNVHPEYDAFHETISDKESLLQGFASDEEISHLFLSAVGGKFIKARITFPFYPELEESVSDTINLLRFLVHREILGKNEDV